MREIHERFAWYVRMGTNPHRREDAEDKNSGGN